MAERLERSGGGLPFQIYLGRGKGGVLGARDEFDKEERFAGQVLYFVDRDHDNFIGLQSSRADTYVTDFYSMEWEVCSSAVFLDVLRDCCVVQSEDEVLVQVHQIFIEDYAVFVRRARIIMALVILLRRRDLDPQVKLLKFNTVFRWDGLRLLARRISVAEIMAKLEVQSNVAFRDLPNLAKSLRGMDDREIVRGKLVVEFMVDLLARLVEQGECKKANGEVLKLRTGVGRGNYCHLAMRHSSTPESLLRFLRSALDGVLGK